MAPSTKTAKVIETEKNESSDLLSAYSAENMQHNMKIIYYCRTFLSIVAGVIAGVLGLTGLQGFICYFIIMVVASGALTLKAKADISLYFDSWQRVAFDGIFQGLMSFVLFWTFAYDIVHIF